jgi:two-component system, NtrC family, sensor histidine kinase PilS
LQLTRLRLSAAPEEVPLRALLDPRRFLRWVYMGRLSLATAILLAAFAVWNRDTTEKSDLLITSVAFAATVLWTLASFWYSEIYRGKLRPTFAYLQSIFDLLLVTASVHVTGGSMSQFAALYILVIASASLLLPPGGGLLIAALGNVLYFADAVWGSASPPTAAVWLQLGIFGIVALGSAFLGSKLQEAGKGEAVAELSQFRLQASDILFNIRSGVITVDAKGRLLYANPSAHQLLDLPLEAAAGEPILDRVRSRSAELAQALERAVSRRLRTTRGQGTVTIGEESFPIGLTTTYIEAADEDVDTRTATAIFQDISDEKRLETLRLRAERLEGVAELSASLAHEIRNPLAAVRSAVEQLARMPRAGDDEQTLSRLILRESDRLSRLLTEFLDFSRVRPTRSEPVDVGRIAVEATRLAGSHPDRSPEVRMECEVDPSAEAFVDGDDDLLHRAVFNLILNAVQVTPPGGMVRVEVKPAGAGQVLGSAMIESGPLAIMVSDTGPGIPASIRDRLFDPFFTTRPGGTGLGLAVVHRAIEAHRGYVLIDSGPVGTRFTIVLPRSEHRGSGRSASPALTEATT